MELLSVLEKKKFLLFLTTFFFLLALVLTTSQLGERQLIEKRAASNPGENASLTLTDSVAAYAGDLFEAPIFINTDGAGIIGVDVVLDFSADLGKIELVDIEPDAQTTTSLNFFLPIDDTGSFDRELIKNRANSLGKIEFGAVAFNPSGGQPSTPFNGVLGPDNPFATLTFKVNPDLEPPQQAIIAVVHTPGETTDTNLVELQSASDILAIANSLILTIPLSPTPTPSPKPSPTSTLTPTPRPTATPTPKPTVTPIPWPTATPTLAPIGQEGTLEGAVSNSRTGEKISDAKLIVSLYGVKGKKGKAGTIYTDTAGWYTTDLKPCRYSVKVSAKHYASQTKDAYVYVDETTFLHFFLEPRGKKTLVETLGEFFAPVTDFFSQILGL